ncbi:MAG: DNA polymerase III subunit gamma/tau [Oligoflexus sp.]
MAYQSLARKYRPRQFSDMVGQDGVTKALGNAIQLGRIPHGVIFSGVRGIGKTTVARLYAKALNCDKGPSEEPCDQCTSCLAINDGRHEDVLEIDGASHTGVDDIRAIQETLDYVPQRSKFKVYIIDEVHMLSQSAFNALLKTLEEPPSHVVFIFATTELNKVPETILSRCQTFHLKRLSMACIMDRLAYILGKENIPYQAHALALVAKEGRGSMRDALTFLDQVVAVGNGQVHMEAMDKLLAFASSKPFLAMLESLLSKQAQPCLEMIASWDQQGVPLAEVVEELIKFVRHSFIVRELGTDSVELLLTGLDPEEIEQLAGIAKKSSDFDCNRLFRSLVQCRKELEGSNLDRYVFENYVMEWCFDPGLPDLRNLGQILQQASNGNLPNREMRRENTAAPAPLRTDPAPASSPNPAPKREMSLKQRFQKTAEQVQQRFQATPSQPAAVKEEVSAEQQEAASPPKQEAEAKAVPPAPEPMQTPNDWPATWRDLVDQWKKQKPLQARVLEEIYPISYSQQLIHVKVESKSFAASRLVNPESQNRLRGHFQQLFGFQGELRVTIFDKTEEKPEQAPGEVPVGVTANPRPESILEVKQREKRDMREQLKTELTQHPLTREVLAAFGGKISKIEFEDGTSESPGGHNGIHESRNP